MEVVNRSTLNNYSITKFERTTVTMTTHQSCSLPLDQGVVLVIINAILSLVGTFGNILIIMAVLKSPRLRQKPSNFLLLSLAVADLLVTMVAQPLFTASVSMKAFLQRCHREIDMLYAIAAPLAGSSSVFHLAAISVDRSLSALLPHKHRAIIKKGLKVMICTCWGLSALVVCIIVVFPASSFAVYITLLLCLVIMIIAYGMILYKILVNRVVNVPASTARDRAMEKRVSGTVAIIIALFAVCWVPLIVFHLSAQTNNVSQSTYWWIRTLYLANSSMNFIVYSLRIKQFRSAYVKIINRRLRRLGKLLPKKCRCQCLDSLPRNFSQSTLHTPVSPLSTTAAPVAMNIIRKDELEALNVEKNVGDANRYVMQRQGDDRFTPSEGEGVDLPLKQENETDITQTEMTGMDLLQQTQVENEKDLIGEKAVDFPQKQAESEIDLTQTEEKLMDLSQEREENEMDLSQTNKKDIDFPQKQSENGSDLTETEEKVMDLPQKREMD